MNIGRLYGAYRSDDVHPGMRMIAQSATEALRHLRDYLGELTDVSTTDDTVTCRCGEHYFTIRPITLLELKAAEAVDTPDGYWYPRSNE